MTLPQTVVARTFVSIPQRSAGETWSAIVDLITPAGTEARAELESIRGIACSVIADESLRDEPIVVHGAGPRLRVYALYGDDAIEGDAGSESSLSFVPTNGPWKMSLPCTVEDLGWVAKALAANSSRITARAPGKAVSEDESGRASRQESDSGTRLDVNLDAFLRL